MASTLGLKDPRNTRRPPASMGSWALQEAVRRRVGQTAPNAFRRRFDRITIGMFLGGLALGTAGCILGASMPYCHPVGVTISILWWGIYLGCLGASIGAGIGGLFGLRKARNQTTNSA